MHSKPTKLNLSTKDVQAVARETANKIRNIREGEKGEEDKEEEEKKRN